jgi:hypothetical protein
MFSRCDADPTVPLPLLRQPYEGAVEFGEDLMSNEIGDRVTVHRPDAARR